MVVEKAERVRVALAGQLDERDQAAPVRLALLGGSRLAVVVVRPSGAAGGRARASARPTLGDGGLGEQHEGAADPGDLWIE